ncbi:5-(carboxyamino)imidazole ribonucleotide synthase [Algivirga pacifica]|uniref:N5-carboxyaminoimidazole ribonucleotide synthase n=1 Tax=Algivirga pacifica TaxID=1162670 RepID=A0ABP9D4Y1_9BACT
MQQEADKQSKLGVLGGGQLGRMLIQAGMNLNLHTKVLDPDAEAPCRDLASEFVVGSLTDYKTVIEFGQDVDTLTIEIENVNTDALMDLQKQGVKVYPQPEIIRMIQDKRTQKLFFREHNIPTSEFFLTSNKEELQDFIQFLPAVHKIGKGGYDGKGVIKLSSEEDFDKAFDAPSVLEKLVDIEKEISIIIARTIKGEVKAYPAVELVYHDANLVDYLLGPAAISNEVAEEAERIATDLVNEMEFVGLLAVELFVTKSGKVLVNEIAPRTHNSGHQTIEANYTSQFEQHLRAVLELPLGSTQLRTPSAMVNVLGEEGYTGMAHYEGLSEVLGKEGVYIHLYGKKITKPNRKMGHVTIIDENKEQLLEKVDFVKKTLKVISLEDQDADTTEEVTEDDE